MTYSVGGMLAWRKTSSWKDSRSGSRGQQFHKSEVIESPRLIPRPVESYLKFSKADPVELWLSVEFPDNESVVQISTEV